MAEHFLDRPFTGVVGVSAAIFRKALENGTQLIGLFGVCIANVVFRNEGDIVAVGGAYSVGSSLNIGFCVVC